jgi:hypothetical protein
VLLTLAVLDALGAHSNWSPVAALPTAGDGPVTPLGVVKSVAAAGSLANAPGLARWKLCKLREAIENELLSACPSIDTAVLRYTLLSTHANMLLLPAVPLEVASHFLGAYFRESPIVGVLAPVAAGTCCVVKLLCPLGDSMLLVRVSAVSVSDTFVSAARLCIGCVLRIL